MKRVFTLLLVLVLVVSFAACDSQELTMRELIAANQLETLLKTYDSIYIHGTINGELYTDYYLADTCAYEKHKTWSMYMSDSAVYGCNEGVYERRVYLTKDGLVDLAAYRAGQYADVIFSKDSMLEKIQSVTEADGKITVTTTMDRKKLKKVIGQENARSFEGVYVLDAETYAMISGKGVATLDDGTSTVVTMECTYNAQQPEELDAFLAYENQTEDLRTITMVFHSGTKKEKTEHIQSPKGISMGLAMPEGVTESISVYADAACTVPHQSNGDFTSDTAVYIK